MKSPTIRRRLLSTVSALALLGSIFVASDADAAEADRPLLWIELGGQADNVTGQGDIFAPSFIAANPNSSVLQSITPLQAQKPALFDLGENGRISFEPKDSDWIFSAGIRYGRSSGSRHVDHQTTGVHYKYKSGSPRTSNPFTTANFADTKVDRSEKYEILDFSVGKDVGLGLFGRAASSSLSLGVRFVRFASKESFDIRARPDFHTNILTFGGYTIPLKYFHTYHATGHASRSFRGVGPTLSWTGSAPFVGDEQEGELAFDWDAAAGLLFGQQRAAVRHHESGHYVKFINDGPSSYQLVYNHPTTGHIMDRSVTVPNLSGSIGVSYRVQDFKVSLCYRADFFFGAIDAGIDARKSETLGFKGPYASISVGLGD
jgi:iron complex outermembrane receptor protein